jgi:hypothetical protein
MIRSVIVLVVGLVLGACGADAPDPSAAETAYGAPVDATSAIPAPAITAEPDRYEGGRVTVDGRIVSVTSGGCTLHLGTEEGPPLRVEAGRTREEACAWRVPVETNGFAVAAGTLRVAGDTLRLVASGVRVTPVRLSLDS